MALPTNIIGVGGFEGVRGLFYLLYSVLILTLRLQKPGGGCQSPLHYPLSRCPYELRGFGHTVIWIGQSQTVTRFSACNYQIPPFSLIALHSALYMS